MQRWFFVDTAETSSLLSLTSSTASSKSIEPAREWLFRVRASNLHKDEVVCVVGDVPELGEWRPERGIPLVQEESEGSQDGSSVWSRTVLLPATAISYRYCVCVIVEAGLQIIVRTWEAAVRPRLITRTQVSDAANDEPMDYGVFGSAGRPDRGWLNQETVVQLKLCNGPLTLWRAKLADRPILVKVTPVGLLKHSTIQPKTISEAMDESLSADTQDAVEIPRHAYTEVVSLYEDNTAFHLQPQFGTELRKGDMLVFQSTVLFPANVAFLIDLYVKSSHAADRECPYHVGFSYLLPSVLQGSEGRVVLPVTSTKHRPLGEIRIEYLVVRPMANFHCDMAVSFARHWKKTRSGLDVGHRGSGSSFKTQNCAEVRENTVASLKNAIDHGADFVEFDVQLSKDLIPIVYHDFHVCISMKKKHLNENDMLELPVKELTLAQLHLLKVYHLSEGKSKNQRFFDDDLEDHQPFPTLQHVLQVLNVHVGFNIEIKWTMQLNDGSYELYHPTDLNLYLDTILEVVLRYGGERRIIFSCFNPDICSVIRYKQNKYPVMFLTVGESKVYPRYYDPRCWSIPAAVQYANMIEILGINAHTEDLLRDPSLVQLVKMANLVLFSWGDENADPATIKFLKELGVHGVIFDKIYQFSSKEVKESIFMVEARDSQKDLIRMAAAASSSENQQPQPTEQPIPQTIEQPLLDINRARQELGDVLSTATSLNSLESRMSDYITNGTC